VSGSAPLVARSEAQATLCALVALARAGDDVLAIGKAPAWLAGVCAIVRVRSRSTTLEQAFDEIGEHTAALLVREPAAELLEALVELGPPVICLGPCVGVAAITVVEIAPERVEIRTGALDAVRAGALARALEALAS